MDYFPEEKIAFALTSNGNNYNANEIPVTVLNAAFGRTFDVPDFSVYIIRPEELARYNVEYPPSKLPIKITITNNGKNLIAQAGGQAAMELEAAAKDTFRFAKAGIVLVFDPAQKTMVLKQVGGEFLFSKN